MDVPGATVNGVAQYRALSSGKATLTRSGSALTGQAQSPGSRPEARAGQAVSASSAGRMTINLHKACGETVLQREVLGAGHPREPAHGVARLAQAPVDLVVVATRGAGRGDLVSQVTDGVLVDRAEALDPLGRRL